MAAALDVSLKERGAGREGRLLAVLAAIYVLSFADRTVLNLFVDPIRAELSLSDTQMGILIGPAFAALYLVLSLPLGILSDRLPRAALICCGCLLWSGATIFCGLATSFEALLVGRMLVGAGEAVLAPAAYGLIASHFPRHKVSSALSMFSAGVWVGVGAALILGAGSFVSLQRGDTAGPHFSNWRVVMCAVGAAGLPLAALVVRFREPRRPKPEAGSETRATGAFAYLRANRLFYICHLIGFGLFALAAQAVIAWTPTALARDHGFSLGHVGLVLGCLHLTFSVAGIVVAGALADRGVSRGRAAAPMTFGALGTLGLSISVATFAVGQGALVYAALAALCFFVSFPLGLAASALQLSAPPEIRGTVSGLYVLMTGILGSAAGPALVPLIAGSGLPLGSALASVAGVAAIVATGLLILGRAPLRTISARLRQF
ncbi:MFS transporter [Sphingomonas sp. Root720]|uniref:MFS transporter n=1 Tax=Sphingomonas sp. Root720 TaxID=1736595 RepID=UPI000AE16EA7|nr:MFS transporter [Sphingomonas sp. Root720]